MCPVMAADGPPAGVGWVAETPRGVYLLLVDQASLSKRGWVLFGGGYEQGESPAETAARETEEETRWILIFIIKGHRESMVRIQLFRQLVSGGEGE